MSNRPLVIFTHYYPFGEMELFLETEIRYLKEVFPRIVVIPNMIRGPMRSVPDGVVVETSFAKTHCGKDLVSQARKAWRALMHLPFYTELWKAPKQAAHLRKLVGYASEVSRCLKWLKGYMNAHPHLHDAIFYTYWFYDHTTAIARLKQSYPGIDVVSRAHGFDLYEEEYAPAYIPFRQYSARSVDRLVLISDHGCKYINARFPEAATRTDVSRLGIEDPGFVVRGSGKDAFIIVSCSHMVPLKRLHLQIDGIASFARKNPDVQVIWQHIGDGPLREKVFAYASKVLPHWVKWTLVGHKNNREVFDLYRELQPDLFMLLSETEGLPVSIMEAHACGIPAMATAVGGVPEIVNDGNGVLLSAHPTPDEIARGMAGIWHQPGLLASMKIEARRLWEEHFNAPQNYRRFASLLRSCGDADARGLEAGGNQN